MKNVKLPRRRIRIFGISQLDADLWTVADRLDTYVAIYSIPLRVHETNHWRVEIGIPGVGVLAGFGTTLTQAKQRLRDLLIERTILKYVD